MNDVAVLYLTERGRKIADRIAAATPGAEPIDAKPDIASAVAAAWASRQGLVFVMASGIAVRTIAPHLSDKQTDPAVVVVDESGRFAISLVSGHIGGANELAKEVAGILDAMPVITTASDNLGLTAIDLWARENRLAPDPPDGLTRAAATLVKNGRLRVFVEDELLSAGGPSREPDDEVATEIGTPPPGKRHPMKLTLPVDFTPVLFASKADLIISHRIFRSSKAPSLRPKNLILGIGCNRGASAKVIEQFIVDVLESKRLSPLSVLRLATIDLKEDETGLLEVSRKRGWPLIFFNKDELNTITETSKLRTSDSVFRATGAHAVSEPAALLASGSNKLIVEKQSCKDVTLAIALVA